MTQKPQKNRYRNNQLLPWRALKQCKKTIQTTHCSPSINPYSGRTEEQGHHISNLHQSTRSSSQCAGKSPRIYTHESTIAPECLTLRPHTANSLLFLLFPPGHPYTNCPLIPLPACGQACSLRGVRRKRGATRAEGSSKQTVRETTDPGTRKLTGTDHNLLPLLEDQCYRVMQPHRFTDH